MALNRGVFALVNTNVYTYRSEERRVQALGWRDRESGKESHLKVSLNGKNSVLPMHNKELGTGLVNAIKKQLGLK